MRLLLVLLVVVFGVAAWSMLMRTDRFIDAVFWPRLEDEIADLAGKELPKLGTSEQSLLTRTMAEMEKDGAGITAFPTYADRLSPNNQAVDMIRLRIRDLRLAVQGMGLVTLACFLFLLLLLRIVYGSAERRWKPFLWLYGMFNHDAAARQPYGLVRSFSPMQRKMFELAFAASKGHSDGSFEFDPAKFGAQVWPGEQTLTDRRRGLLAITFTELCEEFYYFQIPSRNGVAIRTYCPVVPFEDQVKREWVRDASGREVEAFTAGRFRFSPPLYDEFLRSRYGKLPHPVAYALDDRRHPFAFRVYLTVWEQLLERRQAQAAMSAPGNASAPTNLAELPLFPLLERACFDVSQEHDETILERFHADLTNLRELGLIKSWVVEEHGEKLHPLWYKNAELFSYQVETNIYRLNTGILTPKLYRFELASWAELDEIRIERRRCAFVDNLNTSCTRPAIPNSPYCKRHAKALDFETPKLFYEKVKSLTAPETVATTTDKSGYTADDLPATPAVIIVPPTNPTSEGGNSGS